MDEIVPVCECGGGVYFVDNSNEEGKEFRIWGECDICGKKGKEFDNLDDAFEDVVGW